MICDTKCYNAAINAINKKKIYIYIYHINIYFIYTYIYICVCIYIVKSFAACSLTKYKIEKNYILFSQDVSNRFESFFNSKVT